MVDSEDIILEKIKTQELSLQINNLSNTFQQNTTIHDTPPETHKFKQWILIINPNPNIKNIALFATK